MCGALVVQESNTAYLKVENSAQEISRLSPYQYSAPQSVPDKNQLILSDKVCPTDHYKD